MSNETKFTQGPLCVVRTSGNSLDIVDKEGMKRAEIIRDDDDVFEVDHATMALYAAAPELYAALESLLEMGAACTKDADVIENIQRREIAANVLRKARGE